MIFAEDITTYNPDWMLVQCMINSLTNKVDNETTITCNGIPFICDTNLIGRKLLMYRHAIAVQQMGRESGRYLKLLRDKMLRDVKDINELAKSRKATDKKQSKFTTKGEEYLHKSAGTKDIQVTKDTHVCRRTRSRRKQNLARQQKLRKLPTKANRSKNVGKKKYAKYKCCFVGCHSSTLDNDVHFRRLPPPPDEKKQPVDKDSIRKWKNYYRKKLHHYLFIDRVGLQNKVVTNPRNLRICNKHKFKDEKRSVSFMRKGILVNQSVTFKNVPLAYGVKWNATTLSRGFGSDRYMCKIVSKAVDGFRQLQQYVEVNENARDDVPIPVNDCVAATAGIEKSLNFNTTTFDEEFCGPNHKKKRRKVFLKTVNDPMKSTVHLKEPTVQPGKLPSCEIKRRTGFKSESDMMAFIIVVCNADKQKILCTSSNLTWFEEWFFYFEFIWGRTLLRWEDAASVKEYGVSKFTLQTIFSSKLKMVLRCRRSWPKYARYHEDCELRKSRWEERYSGVRLILWDNTNISMQYKPSDPQLQRITYSSYYSENCAKGGVFVQLCGWMGVHNLWVGASSDTLYI